jgi:hypothetical protein
MLFTLFTLASRYPVNIANPCLSQVTEEVEPVYLMIGQFIARAFDFKPADTPFGVK